MSLELVRFQSLGRLPPGDTVYCGLTSPNFGWSWPGAPARSLSQNEARLGFLAAGALPSTG